MLEGLIERAEFEPRVAGLRQRLASLEEQRRGLVERTRLGSQLSLIIGRLEAFAARIEQNLDQLDRQQKRGLVRILVRRIEIDRDEVNVVFRVEPPPLPPEPVGLPTEQLVQRCHGHADRGGGPRPAATRRCATWSGRAHAAAMEAVRRARSARSSAFLLRHRAALPAQDELGWRTGCWLAAGAGVRPPGPADRAAGELHRGVEPRRGAESRLERRARSCDLLGACPVSYGLCRRCAASNRTSR